MLTDWHGNSVSGATEEALILFHRALRAFNLYRGDPVGLLNDAVAIAPEFAMAHIARAHLFAVASDPAAMTRARNLLRGARDLSLNAREASHVAALMPLFAGEWTQAALAFEHHNVRYPRDLLALQTGHLLDFFRANARALRDRIARVLVQWQPDMPGYSCLLGMYAFGLEECGDYAHAEASGRQAIDLEPCDCWAHHAVAHVMEMQGRAAEGVDWMTSRQEYWAGADNNFKVHNWWHLALFQLDLERPEAALSLYDSSVRHERSTIVTDLVDATSLLWRLELGGCDVGDRWVELATEWDRHADGRTYAFNDWHAAMAYLGAGRNADVARLSATLQAAVGAPTEAGRWACEVAHPLVAGFSAYRTGHYAEAIELLWRQRHIVNAFGGSHAQRDIIDCTLQEAALRGGFRDVATALANERLAQKPNSYMNLSFLARSRACLN